MNEEQAGEIDRDIAADAVMGGRLMLRQSRHGHRAGTDAMLLAAACSVEPGELLIDVGSGVGTVGLAVSLREPDLSAVLLDVDPAAAALADENCRLNGMEARVRAVCADLFDPVALRSVGLSGETADVVVTNPPFFLGTDCRASTDAAKARAHVLRGGPEMHGEWLRAAVSLLAPKGRFYAIHRPEALPSLLAACGGRLGAVALIPVHARSDGPAIRLLMSAVKGSRAPLSIGPPFVLHEPDGRFTRAAEAVHRGEAHILL